MKAGKAMPAFSADNMATFTKWQDQLRLQDFGGNCKYEEANAALVEFQDCFIDLVQFARQQRGR